MLSYDMKLIPLISAKYEKIQAAYELLGAVITNCPQSILPQDEAVLAKALLKARQGAEKQQSRTLACVIKSRSFMQIKIIWTKSCTDRCCSIFRQTLQECIN